MSKSSKRLSLYLAILLLATITSAVLRTVALELHLNDDLVYFNSNTLNIISAAVMVALCVFSVSYSFIPKQKMMPASSFVNPQTYIPSGLVAIALIFSGTELLHEFASLQASKAANANISLSVIIILSILFAFISVICFFLNVFFERRESKTRAAFTLAAVMYLALYSGYLYFSTHLPLNAPNKSVDMMAHVALSIFFLYETRISLGRALWKPYVSFGMITAALCFYSSLPSLIFYFTNGASDTAIISASIAENVLVFVLGIYTSCRLSLVLTLVPNKTCTVALAVEKMAQLREEEMQAAETQRQIAESETPRETNSDDSKSAGSNYEMDIASLTNQNLTSDNPDQEKE